MFTALRRTRQAMQGGVRRPRPAPGVRPRRPARPAVRGADRGSALDDVTDDSANRALATLQVAPAALVRAMEDVPVETLRPLELPDLDVPSRPVRRTPLPALDGLAETVWQDVASRRPRGRRDFRTADVLLVVADLQEGTVARALASLDVDRRDLRDAATNEATTPR